MNLGTKQKYPEVTEIQTLVKKNQDMKKEIETLNRDKVKLVEENQKSRAILQELKNKVMCPVCLVIPRNVEEVSMCSNGHFLCGTCRLKVMGSENVEKKCPSCRVSIIDPIRCLLATVMIENIHHKCEFEGCSERIPYKRYDEHLENCDFRIVLCPEPDCEETVSFHQVDIHHSMCHTWDAGHHNGGSLSWFLPKKMYSKSIFNWEAGTLKIYSRTFYFRMKRVEKIYMIEVVMKGSLEECKKFVVEISGSKLLKQEIEPRPISMEEWGKVYLLLPESAIEQEWIEDEDNYCIKLIVKVTKR